MIKYFCDKCEKEIPEGDLHGRSVLGRISATVRPKGEFAKGLFVEVITGLDKTSNAGEFCTHCILDTLYELDDRK